MKKVPILIDCDTGTDDAIAIVAALYSPAFDVRAITTVEGNVALKYTSQNTLNLVRFDNSGPLAERGQALAELILETALEGRTA